MNNTPCYNVLTPKPEKDVFRDILKEFSESLFYVEQQIDGILWEHRKELTEQQKQYLEILKDRIDDIVVDVDSEV